MHASRVNKSACVPSSVAPQAPCRARHQRRRRARALYARGALHEHPQEPAAAPAIAADDAVRRIRHRCTHSRRHAGPLPAVAASRCSSPGSPAGSARCPRPSRRARRGSTASARSSWPRVEGDVVDDVVNSAFADLALNWAAHVYC